MELVPTLVLTFLTQAIDNNKFTAVSPLAWKELHFLLLNNSLRKDLIKHKGNSKYYRYYTFAASIKCIYPSIYCE